MGQDCHKCRYREYELTEEPCSKCSQQAVDYYEYESDEDYNARKKEEE